QNPVDRTMYFRYSFNLDRALVKSEVAFKIELMSFGSDVKVWINGQELTLDDRVKRGRHDFSVPPLPKKPAPPPKGAPAPPPVPPEKQRPVSDFVRAGRNVIAVQVVPTAKPGEILFQLRFDQVKSPERLPEEIDPKVADEVSQKLVTHKAVVC